MLKKSILPLLFLLFITTITTSTRPAAAQDPASEVIRLVNEFRISLGLPPFQVNALLSVAAQNQAYYMSVNNIYSHTGAGGSTPQDRANAAGYSGRVTENIVGGTNLSPKQGLIWWQNSPVHYNTITSQNYTEIGAGFAQGSDQNFYAIVVGNPGGAPAPTNTTGRNNPELGEALRVIPITLAEPAEDGSITHEVQDGQSLWMLSAHYDVPLSELLWINSLSETDFVTPGEKIIIRLAEGQAPPPTPLPPSTHLVKSGQTPWTIAAIYGLSLTDFLWYNGLPEDAILQPGDEVLIRMPEGFVPPPTPTPQLSHIVRSGDTLWGVAISYGLSLEQLLAYNNLPAEALLSIGQELWIQPPPVTPSPTPLPTATATLTPAGTTPTPAAVAMVQVSNSAEPTRANTPVPTPLPAAEEAPAGEQTTSFGASLFLGIAILCLAGAGWFILRG